MQFNPVLKRGRGVAPTCMLYKLCKVCSSNVVYFLCESIRPAAAGTQSQAWVGACVKQSVPVVELLV